MDEQLLDSWDVHNKMLYKLYDAIPPQYFATERGRSVGSSFVHINNMRLQWIKAARPKLMEGTITIPAKTKEDRAKITKEAVRPALEISEKVVREMFALALSGQKVSHMTPSIHVKLTATIAHEWYHIGEICMMLGEAGLKFDDTIAYGIWEWK